MSGAVTNYLWSYLKTVCLRPAVQRLNSTSVSALSFLYVLKISCERFFTSSCFNENCLLLVKRHCLMRELASWDHSDIVCFLFIDEETFRAMFPARMLPVPATSKWPRIYSALFQQAPKALTTSIKLHEFPDQTAKSNITRNPAKIAFTALSDDEELSGKLFYFWCERGKTLRSEPHTLSPFTHSLKNRAMYDDGRCISKSNRGWKIARQRWTWVGCEGAWWYLTLNRWSGWVNIWKYF